MSYKTLSRHVLLFFFISLLVLSCKKEQKTLELWYNKPAKTWEEALPIGNGRLGAMIYGNPDEEHIQFNEETLWDGGPRSYQRENASEHLAAIRSLLFEGKQKEAEALAGKTFMGRLAYEDDFLTNKKAWSDSLLHLAVVQKGIRPNCNDDQWPVMFIDKKSVWERKGHPDMNGSLLFRKKIDIPLSWKGHSLIINLGKIKDEDFTYFNGHLIGSSDKANTNRTYEIPAKHVRTGENVIVVLINNYVSTGGFNAVRKAPYKMNLSMNNKNIDPIFIEGDWKYKIIDTHPPFFPQYQAEYQPFADLKIQFKNQDSAHQYRRSLDLGQALAATTYKINGVTFTREYLASAPDDLIAMRFSADKKDQISFKAAFTTLHPIHSTYKVDETTLALSLAVEDGEMKGLAYLNIKVKDGNVSVTDSSIVVTNASEAVLKLVAATNYKSYKDISGKPEARCAAYLEKVKSKDYNQIKQAHLTDYTTLFKRFDITLGGEDKRSIPTDKRIEQIKETPDNDLAATYVQYARYLMLSSGRQGTNPPNLQGIWNDKIYPAWGSKYTTNINCEMNFWPVEGLNIAECHNSLFKLIDEVAEEGRKTAKMHYNARGWVLHHNTDQWRGTAPINNANHGIWVTGGAWLCQHLWEHYQYSQDVDYLKQRAYPLMKGSAEFFLDFLVEDPLTGALISSPSNSPEQGGLVSGPTMDHQIIRSLFKNVILCTNILDTDHDFAATVQACLNKMAADKIGKHGQLMEWMDDVDDIQNHHRHVSHLWAVHPGNDINWDETPELMKAAKQSLIYRGDDGTGWSLAWKINFWARFMDGDHANRMIQLLLSSAIDPERTSSGGSYPNLFDAHPPFQIDGNFGGAAGIMEMIVQSHLGYIHVLPALPSSWPNGSIVGLRVRGGFEIDMSWENSVLKSLRVTSKAGKILRIKYGDQMIEETTEAGKKYSFDKELNAP